MKAIVCEEPGILTFELRSPPSRRADEVLVAISRVGLCGTDFHIFTGHHPFLEYPRVIGHELAGHVVEAPAGSSFHEGQLVTINPYIACGHCIACRRGKPNCCSAIHVLGVHADGGMCDLLSVPQQALVDATGLSVDQAAMVEFLAIGAHAVRRSDLAAGDRALIVGAGPIGVAAGLFARLVGADVTLTDVREARLRFAAEKLGFERTIVTGPELGDALRAQTEGDMFDKVFDATGNIKAMRAGLDYLAHGGTYVLISVVKDDLVFPDPEFHKRETTLLASRNALAEDFALVIKAIKTGLITTDALNTHSLSVEDLPARMPGLLDEADSMCKAIVAF